jgi:DNA-cytosine methyltransferase
MKYISFFSGIGGFECAIKRVCGENATCVGYSEVKKSAIEIYSRHFPHHKNLGDVCEITEEKIDDVIRGGCDLVVCGFPCTNLSSMASLRGDNSGLQGSKSGLFHEFLRLFKIIMKKYPGVNYIIENNASMSKENRDMITELLKNTHPCVFMTHIDASIVSIQTRKRIFWTNFCVKIEPKLYIEWNDFLDPINDIDKKYFMSNKYVNGMNTSIPSRTTRQKIQAVNVGENLWKFERINSVNEKSRFQFSQHSDNGSLNDIPYAYPIGRTRPLCAGGGGGFSRGLLVDRRFGKNDSEIFALRYFTYEEKERMFGFEVGYTIGLSDTKRSDLLGNSISVYVVMEILQKIPFQV